MIPIYQLEPDDLVEPEKKEDSEEEPDYEEPDELVDKALDQWYEWLAK